MIYKITLSYNGAAFKGWQIQNNAQSVQGSIQDALYKLLQEDIKVVGAGRTDSGVHSSYYVAHFKSNDKLNTKLLIYKLNAILPKTLVIHTIEETSEDFHARFDASLRQYKYLIHLTKDPFISDSSFFCAYNLDIAEIKKACTYLIGRHDCSCFEKTGGDNTNSFCDIFEASLKEYTPQHISLLGYPNKENSYFVFSISANRFLRNMVRAIVGTLIDIGRGKHKAEYIEYLLQDGKRSNAGESVPGHALYLVDIKY